MLISCKCLNVTANIVENYSPDSPSSPLTGNAPKAIELHLDGLQEQSKTYTDYDRFFKEALGPYQPQIVAVKKEQNDLVQIIQICDWSINQCVNCSHIVYAVNEKEFAYVFNSNLMINQEEINSLKSSENFSVTFRILMNQKFPNLNFFGANKNALQFPKVRSLSDQFHEVLQKETAATDERIRRYSEQQFALLKMFRERAEQELQILVSLVCRLPENLSIMPDSNVGKNKLSHLETPPTTPDSTPMTIGNSPPIKSQEGAAALLPIGIKVKKGKINSSSKSQQINEDHDFCLFDLDGMENENPSSSPQNMSDVDESDTDEFYAAPDEGMYIPRQLGRQNSVNLAKSLPISMPAVLDRAPEEEYDEQLDDNVDIAASIKALAKSVHGDAVFGDLPRPRFSTQI